MRPDEGAGRRRLHRWALAGVGGVIVAAAGVTLTYTPLFGAHDIRVVGASLSRTEVLAIADVGPGTNVFHLDAAGAEAALERDPRILDARITTTLPDGISIDIEPRAPVGVVGAPAMLVGADGVVIGPARRPEGLPSLRGETGGAVSGGELAAAAAAAGALPPDLRADVAEVVVAADGTLELLLRAGFTAYLGEATELEAKATSLGALLAWAAEGERTVLSADLAVPGSPTAKLEGGSTVVPTS